MALVRTTQTITDGPLFAEVDMGSDDNAPTVRASVVQASTIFYDTPATLDKAERLLAEAASYGSQLVVFPEAFVGGYPRGSTFGVTIGNRTAKGREEFRKYHSAAIDVPGPEVDRLAAMAGKYKVYLVMGVIERDGYTLYCAVLFFDSQGQYLGKHRKCMPTALERIVWGFGDGSTIPVFETPIGKIGAAICAESRMPLLRTALYAKGIEIYCAPTADPRDVWQPSMVHIALEGGCFVLSANQFCRRKDYPPPPEYVFTGIEEDLTPDSVVCAGGSVIISPSGAVLAGPNYEGEALISAELDLGEIARAKFDFDVVGHYARPEVFSLIVRDHPRKPVTFTSTSTEVEDSHKTAAENREESQKDMALVTTTQTLNDGPLFAEVDMGSDYNAPTVRATVVQASTIFCNTPATLDKAERLLAEAASHGSQLVVFPEAFVGGYPRGSTFGYGVTIENGTAKGTEDFRKYHSAAIDVPGPEVDRLAAMAGKYKLYLVMGVIERDGYTLYCTVLFFDSQGRYLGKHRKLMPTALERIVWGFGDGSTIPVFETPIGKIGAAICWENRMPLLRTAMYAKGIEIYCAPTADARDVWQASMTHIALEGGCFVLSANQFCRRKDYPPPLEYEFQGTEENLTPDSVVCAGGSVIISPSGAVLAGPNYEGEALISADLDLGEIARAKFDFDVVGHYARPEVLSLIVRDLPTKPVTFTSTSTKVEDSHQ